MFRCIIQAIYYTAHLYLIKTRGVELTTPRSGFRITIQCSTGCQLLTHFAKPSLTLLVIADSVI